MTQTSHITEKRLQLEAAVRLLEEAEMLEYAIRYPSYISGQRMECSLESILSQYDSLIATISQTPLSQSVPGVRVYEMKEEKQNIV